MENEEEPIKSTVLKKCDNLDFGTESPKQVGNCSQDFIEMQNESENEINNFLADGKGNCNKTVHDLAEFHEVIESILELLNAILDDTIHSMDDDDEDVVGLLDLSNDEDCSAMSTDKQDVSDDSGKCSGLNDGFDIFTN